MTLGTTAWICGAMPITMPKNSCDSRPSGHMTATAHVFGVGCSLSLGLLAGWHE